MPDKDFTRFFEGEMAGDLFEVERERRKFLQKAGISFLGLMVGLILIVNLIPSISLFLIVAYIAIAWSWSSRFYTGYRDIFKKKVIEKMVRFIHPSLSYEALNSIQRRLFDESGLYDPSSYNSYAGDDYVSGTVGSTQIELSELCVEHVHEHNNKKNRSIIFKGLFFVADFNKNFKGRTFVMTDFAERLLGRLGTYLQELRKKRGELVKLENAEFERNFSVYSADQVEARYILSTSLIEKILAFRRSSKSYVQLAFVNSKVFVGLTHYGSLFEPPVISTVLNPKIIKGFYDDMTLILSLVEELGLNTRIWGK